MLAAAHHVMSHWSQALLFALATVLFIVGTILAWIPKQWVLVMISAGLAVSAFVGFFYNLTLS